MSFNYNYLNKLGADCTVPKDKFKVVPKSRYKPPKTPALLFAEIYLNVEYKLLSGTNDGVLRVYLMRENPADDTLWGELPLLRGRSNAFDTKLGMKRWGSDDAGRYVHFRVRAYGTNWCRLNDSCYSVYSQVW
jgi:hypothetical protein